MDARLASELLTEDIEGVLGAVVMQRSARYSWATALSGGGVLGLCAQTETNGRTTFGDGHANATPTTVMIRAESKAPFVAGGVATREDATAESKDVSWRITADAHGGASVDIARGSRFALTANLSSLSNAISPNLSSPNLSSPNLTLETRLATASMAPLRAGIAAAASVDWISGRITLSIIRSSHFSSLHSSSATQHQHQHQQQDHHQDQQPISSSSLFITTAADASFNPLTNTRTNLRAALRISPTQQSSCADSVSPWALVFAWNNDSFSDAHNRYSTQHSNQSRILLRRTYSPSLSIACDLTTTHLSDSQSQHTRNAIDNQKISNTYHRSFHNAMPSSVLTLSAKISVPHKDAATQMPSQSHVRTAISTDGTLSASLESAALLPRVAVVASVSFPIAHRAPPPTCGFSLLFK
eukprot:TRINITY_DN5766_c0_g1_i2.p1 TRINITY_DN5766_c0_g1~~TRINITY_DN5766_c0_g1_i2.p1  ORF type:complete len:414 (+),score=85.18 TRINITY_DN5766_c0_g1_i2:47-1288(+)